MPRTLIVDDDPQVQQLLARLLRRHGFEVEVVDNADDAVRFLSIAGPFRYIFLDHDMPGHDGTWLARQIGGTSKKREQFYIPRSRFEHSTLVVISLNKEGAARMTKILKDAGLRVRRIPKNRLVEILSFYRPKGGGKLMEGMGGVFGNSNSK